MKLLTRLMGLPLWCASMLPAATVAAASDVSLAERDAIVQAATQAALAELHLKRGALHLAPDRLKRSGDWVFLMAHVRSPAGERFDYANTDRHDAAQAGAVSDLCAALLRRESSGWKVIQIAVGPTDVAWETWPGDHQAPAELFR